VLYDNAITKLLTSLAIVASVAALTSSASAPQASAHHGLGDIPSGSYYEDAVNWMASEGITYGVTPGCFGPNELVTRGQFVVFLYRLEGEPWSGPATPFVDASAAWLSDAVRWAYRTDVTKGVSATHFAPGAPVTRGDLVTLLWRYRGSPPASTAGRAQAAGVTAGYQIPAVEWALETGLTQPYDGFFNPHKPATRAETATFLHRFESTPDPGPDHEGFCASVAPPPKPNTCYDPPSGYTDYETVNVSVNGGQIDLDDDTDYQLVFPNERVNRNIRVVGGRNIVIIGGHIRIDTDYSNKSQRMGLKFSENEGLIHIEGLRIDGRYLTEGIQFDSPRAQAVLQNIRIDALYGGDNTGIGLNHADLIQPWGGLGAWSDWALRICGLSGGPSHYNGLMLKADQSRLGPVDVRFVDIELVDAPINRNSEYGGGWIGVYMDNVDEVHFHPGTVWIEYNSYRNDGDLSSNVVPRTDGDSIDDLGRHIEWRSSSITGRVYAGQPPTGDYVPAHSVGLGYSR